MEYLIAGIRIDIPHRFTTGAFGMALAPFAAENKTETDAGSNRMAGPVPGTATTAAPSPSETPGTERSAPHPATSPADTAQPDLILHTGLLAGDTAGYCELDAFDFTDADADCRFGRDTEGYLLTMTPRDGSAPARYRMAYGAAAARSDITPGHNPALFRFGVWILFNIAALPLGAVAFHSSVIRYRGRGVLFLGESGTGKSTHTRLWREHIPGAELLNDDSPIIRATDSEALVHGSPWSGKTPCYRNVCQPIRAIVRLSQAPHNRIRRLRAIEAIGALLPSCPPSFAHDETLEDAVCATVSAVVAQVPVYHLECLPDAAAAELAQANAEPEEEDAEVTADGEAIAKELGDRVRFAAADVTDEAAVTAARTDASAPPIAAAACTDTDKRRQHWRPTTC